MNGFGLHCQRKASIFLSVTRNRFGRVPMSSSRKRRNSNEERVSPPPSKRAVKQVSTTTQQAVRNFFTPTSQKTKQEKLSWRIVDHSLIVGRYNVTLSEEGETFPLKSPGDIKVAAFDFDSTIIKTISKAAFARDANDWCWWHGSVPGKLKSLHEEGYHLVIMSNQSGISLRNANGPKIKADRFMQFKQKAGAVFNNLNLPMGIYAATEKDRFRKPMTGMWTEFLKDLRIQNVDMANSIFVGDAGGRIAGTFDGQTYKADFACSDRNFASNIGINYYSPEEFFLGASPREFSRMFDPSIYIGASLEDSPDSLRSKFSLPKKLELVVFVGSPGSGKSTFFKRYLEPLGYERANQDTLKSRERCIKFAEDCLNRGVSVAIDNTNADPEVRKVWTSLAKKFKVSCRCVLFTADKELARHNDVFRALSGLQESNPETREILPQLAFNSYATRFKEPTLEEGFEEIIRVDFVLSGSEEVKEAWGRYWL